MIADNPVYLATRLPAVLVSERLARVQAVTDAEAILVAARTEAEAIRAAAVHDAQEERARGQAQAEELRQAVRDLVIEDSRALAIRDLLATANRLEARFDALSPWLRTLIHTTVTRITGKLKPGDLHRRLVTEALREARPTGTLALRVHPDDVRALAGPFAAELGVAEVIGDPSLAPGACILDCAGGLLDLSVEAQLEAVLKELSAAIAEAAP